MDWVDDPLAPWRALEGQREALPLEDQAVFILICVESILSMHPARDAAGQEYLHAIWDAIGADRSALSTIAEALAQRPDIDDHDAAAWGARRLLDDAYERIPRDGSDAFFPPLADDTAHEVVQDELRWQRSVLASLSASDHAVRIGHLREQARTRGAVSH